jgi:predicted HTH domain antitoxin
MTAFRIADEHAQEVQRLETEALLAVALKLQQAKDDDTVVLKGERE